MTGKYNTATQTVTQELYVKDWSKKKHPGSVSVNSLSYSDGRPAKIFKGKWHKLVSD